jgi:hypothetical protein
VPGRATRRGIAKGPLTRVLVDPSAALHRRLVQGAGTSPPGEDGQFGPALLPHVLTGLFDGALRRAGHVLDVELLEPHQVARRPPRPCTAPGHSGRGCRAGHAVSGSRRCGGRAWSAPGCRTVHAGVLVSAPRARALARAHGPGTVTAAGDPEQAGRQPGLGPVGLGARDGLRRCAYRHLTNRSHDCLLTVSVRIRPKALTRAYAR